MAVIALTWKILADKKDYASLGDYIHHCPSMKYFISSTMLDIYKHVIIIHKETNIFCEI